jgi:hypothetical protein
MGRVQAEAAQRNRKCTFAVAALRHSLSHSGFETQARVTPDVPSGRMLFLEQTAFGRVHTMTFARHPARDVNASRACPTCGRQ